MPIDSAPTIFCCSSLLLYVILLSVRVFVLAVMMFLLLALILLLVSVVVARVGVVAGVAGVTGGGDADGVADDGVVVGVCIVSIS